MPWHARLSLDYQRHGERTVLQHSHDGPLRIFKSLYPEGDAVCHNVIVHPPGGLVGGDVLDIGVQVGAGAHALVSTPGATRFYASDEAFATQQVRLQLDAGARLEWLPLETIAYPGCRADNRWSATLAEGAELMAWDVTALGLPGAASPTSRASSGSGWRFPAAGWSRRASPRTTGACWTHPSVWAATAAWARWCSPPAARWRASGASTCWRWRAKPCSKPRPGWWPAPPAPTTGCWRCGPWRRWWSR